MIRIFDIQHFCVQDGPGIRTTVFLQGCPLHCGWCHNPEALSPKDQMMFYSDKCMNCGMCVRACRYGAQVFNGEKHEYLRENCILCRKCVSACAQRALEISGYNIEEEELFSQIFRDFPFYGKDGGVTFSGGEPLTQYKNLRSLITRCSREGIHTAVETSLYSNEETIEELNEDIDLVICDFKIADPKLHERYTGVNNKIILKNMKNLLQKRASDMWVRTPIIPGVNDNDGSMSQMANFLSPYKIGRVELLPFHDLGQSKYIALGMPYQFSNAETIPEEKMEELRSVLRKNGVSNVI